MGAGLLMVFAGTREKLLRWKPAERRCTTCGRRDGITALPPLTVVACRPTTRATPPRRSTSSSGWGHVTVAPPEAGDGDGLLEFLLGLAIRAVSFAFTASAISTKRLSGRSSNPDWSEPRRAFGSLAAGEKSERSRRRRQLRPSSGHDRSGCGLRGSRHRTGRGSDPNAGAACATRPGAGFTHFVAEVMGANRPRLSVFLGAGFELVRELESGEVELRLPARADLPCPRRAFRSVGRGPVCRSLRPSLSRESVAVVGTSAAGADRRRALPNVLQADFAGAAYPVDRKDDQVAGVRAYRAVDEIPDPVDLAVICLPPSRSSTQPPRRPWRGVRALCVISAGFAEPPLKGARGRRGSRPRRSMARGSSAPTASGSRCHLG